MWRHIEVDGIYQFWIVLLMAAEGWGNSVLNALTVDILILNFCFHIVQSSFSPSLYLLKDVQRKCASIRQPQGGWIL